MICSAPRRFAAITPHRPTAPSPTTAAILPGPTSRASAAWWPVAITSVSVSSDGISASSGADRERDERAVRLRYAHRLALPAVDAVRAVPAAVEARRVQPLAAEDARAVGPEERRATRSPAFTVRTSSPTASTTPTNSWPIRRPPSLGSIALYGQRSLPQMAARVTRTSASVGSTRCASGTVSTRTSCAAYMRVARI